MSKLKRLKISKEDVELKAASLGVTFKKLHPRGETVGINYYYDLTAERKGEKEGHWMRDKISYEAICEATGGRTFASNLRDLWYKMEEII